MSGFAPFKGHLGRISHIAFSPDSRRVATASSSELNVRIWSVDDGHLETAFSFGKASWLKSLSGLAYSPNGETLYVIVDNEVLAWMPATGEIRWRRKVRGYPTLSPDGRVAAVCSGYAEDDHLRLFDLESRRYRGPLHEGFSPKAFSRDGRYLRAQSSEPESSETVLLDVATGEIVWRNVHPSRYLFLNASTMAIHKAGTEEDPDAIVTLLSLPSLEAREEPIEFRHWELIGEWSEETIVTANDGKWCICCSMHDPALRIDGEPSGRILTLESGVSYDVSLAVSPDERWVAISDHAGSLRLVAFEDASTVWRTPSGIPIHRAAVSHDSRRLAVLQGRPRRPAPRTFCWDLEHLTLLGEMEADRHQVDRFADWRFDRSLRWLGKADRWSAEATPLGHEAGIDSDSVGSCTVGYARLTIEHSEDGEVTSQYYETFEGTQVPIPLPQWGECGDRMRTLSHNGRWMGVAGANEVYVIDVETRERVHSMPYPPVEPPQGQEEAEDVDPPSVSVVGVAISEDGARMAVGFTFGPFDVLVYDFAHQKVRKAETCCDTFDSLAFHPNAGCLAVGDAYQEFIALVDPVRRRRNRGLERHASSIRSLDFTPDGRWLVSAAADGQVILWNATTFEPEAILMILSHPGEPARWAVLTPDGQVKGSPGVESEFLFGPRTPPSAPEVST